MADSANTIQINHILQESILNAPPIVVDTKKAQAELEALLMPPVVSDAGCREKLNKKTEEEANLDHIVAFVKEATAKINNATECSELQREAKKALKTLGVNLDDIKASIQKQLDSILPITTVPLNPFKLPKYIKKATVGRILPDLEAALREIKKIVQLISALSDLIKVVQQIVPKLEACAISTRQMVKGFANDELDKVYDRAILKISKEIADAICGGLTDIGVNIKDVIDAVNTSEDIIRSFEDIKNSAEEFITSTGNLVGGHQTALQDLTGIPPGINTSSSAAFLESVSSNTSTQYFQDISAVFKQPPPDLVTIPTITGDAIVGSVLLCSNGTWSSNGVTNNAAFQYEAQWYRGGLEIKGANTFSYTPVIEDLEQVLHCVIIAGNHLNAEVAQSSDTSPVVYNVSEANKPVITGTAAKDQTLTCSTGTWSGVTPMLYYYEWYRGDTTVVQNNSATNTYKCVTADIGSTIKCKVTVSTSRYVLAANSNATSTVTA